MRKSIYSVKTELRESSIHGTGLFARVTIAKGEILFVKNGHIMLNNERCFEKAVEYDWPLSDKYTLGAKEKSERDVIKLYINHSCNPNCGLMGLNAGVAMRDIPPDTEITFDYAMLDNEDYSFECSCGSKDCRKTITGFDWKHFDLQNRYHGYFSNNIQERINQTLL